MKHNKTTYKKNTLKNLKSLKNKLDIIEFKRFYILNKNNEWVKRSFGGQHRPNLGSNRHKAKLNHQKGG